MRPLIIGREPSIVRRGVETVRAQGIPVLGESEDAAAISALASGTVTDLLIGGGVEPSSRDALRQVAAEHGVTVLEAARGGRDVADYLVGVVIPELRRRQ